MKKTTKAAILYYLILFGGFLLFIGVTVVGKVYYSDEVQRMFDNYPYIVFPIIILAFIGYLYVIKRVVLTRNFQSFERMSIERAQKNKDKNTKRLKMIIPILAIYSVAHLLLSVYIIYNVRIGSEVNVFLKFWAMMVAIPFVVLSLTIYCYKNSK